MSVQNSSRAALIALALVSTAGVGGLSAAHAADLEGKKIVKTAPAPAVAETPFFDATFGGRIQSDYNFRGISQTSLNPSVSGYLELTAFQGFAYVGIAPYSLDLPTRPTSENDITFGIRPKYGAFSFDLGGIYYWYPAERAFFDATGVKLTPADTDYFEIEGKVSYAALDNLTFGLNLYHGFDYLHSGVDNTYVSGTAKYTFSDSLLSSTWFKDGALSISGEIGEHFFDGRTQAFLGNIRLPDYTYGNIGVSYNYKVATLDFRFHDTTLSKTECFLLTTDPKGVFSGSGRSNWCGAAFIGTLSFDFTASALGVFDKK